ncbi:hypothetical protein ACQW02_11360 [Humitalea sp. 24SJ18S-53]|uniref:hypothetical protein n=1 Tax=Humitalea sp. 24SJ18S-53 TaxID=3422307 RepID=UPI003D6676BA
MMNPVLPMLFTDGVIDAQVMHGVARITLGQAGGDGKPQPVGQLIVPLGQLPVLANGLIALLKQIEAKVKEAQPPAPAASEGSFRFTG